MNGKAGKVQKADTGVGRDLVDGSGNVQGPGEGLSSSYDSFYAQVVTAQLRAWLPPEPGRVLDLSDPDAGTAQVLAAAGHQVVQVLAGPPRSAFEDRPVSVIADRRGVDWLADRAVDAVVAEGRALSTCLAAEETVHELCRVLRPGGRLLLCADSLLWGLARLAEQGRWAELADSPAADVVLVPDGEGQITRCFWPEELRELLSGAGLEVEWVRPRTVLTPTAVDRALQADPHGLATLVRTELTLAIDRAGDSLGARLVASARLPG